MGLYFGEMYPDKRCPNCGARETNAHLIQCPDKDRTHLLIESIEELEKWMETDSRTDPELFYWIPKYILMQMDKPFSQLGYMSNKMHALAESQDKIGLRNIMEGYISSHFYDIQWFHLLMSSSFLNGFDWKKQFITKILQLTHLQWIIKRSPYMTNFRDIYATSNQRTSYKKLPNSPILAPKRSLTTVDFSLRSTSQNSLHPTWKSNNTGHLQ